MAMQVNASAIWSEYTPFLKTSLMEWTTQLQKRAPYTIKRKRDLTGILRQDWGS